MIPGLVLVSAEWLMLLADAIDDLSEALFGTDDTEKLAALSQLGLVLQRWPEAVAA